MMLLKNMVLNIIVNVLRDPACFVSLRQTSGGEESQSTYDDAKSDREIIPRETPRECVSRPRDAGHVSCDKRNRQTDAGK